MNSSLIFVLLLVSIVMCANVIQTWLKQKKDKPAANEDLEQTLAQNDQLEVTAFVFQESPPLRQHP